MRREILISDGKSRNKLERKLLKNVIYISNIKENLWVYVCICDKWIKCIDWETERYIPFDMLYKI